MSYRSQLFSYNQIYNIQESNKLFLNAVKENILWHINSCADYHDILTKYDFSVENLKQIEDLSKIPPIPTLFLKSNTMLSIPDNKLFLRSTSSGTSGKNKSYMGLDIDTGWNALKMMIMTFQRNNIFSFIPTNYIILGFKPNFKNTVDVGAAKTAFGMTLTSPTIRRRYALNLKDGKYDFNPDSLIETLLKLSKSSLPLRFMGFPSYLYLLLDELQKRNIKLKLPKHSMVFTAGGWKQFYTEKQDKAELYAMVENVLGIPQENCKDFFGAVEHPVPYCSCKNNHFHIPVYSRVIIRHAKTLQPVEFGEQGILNLITPLVKSAPFTSVMTDDIATMHPAEECGCGIPSPYMNILGRSGLEDIKTCAASAADLLKVV